MAGISNHERGLIETILPPRPVAIEPGTALVLLPDGLHFLLVHDVSIGPALEGNGLNRMEVRRVFDDTGHLADAVARIRSAELIVADVTGLNPSVMYLVGIAHALARSPILVSQGNAELPFDVAALRCIEYPPGHEGLIVLRDSLDRAIRNFLACTRHDTT